MVKVNPRDVESATDVKPFGRANDAFIAETEDFAASQDIYPTCLRVAYLRIGLPKSPFVLVSIGIGNVVIEESASILYPAVEPQPRLGLKVEVDAQAVQVIKIFCAVEPDSRRTLETTTIFAAEVEPAGQIDQAWRPELANRGNDRLLPRQLRSWSLIYCPIPNPCSSPGSFEHRSTVEPHRN